MATRIGSETSSVMPNAGAVLRRAVGEGSVKFEPGETFSFLTGPDVFEDVKIRGAGFEAKTERIQQHGVAWGKVSIVALPNAPRGSEAIVTAKSDDPDEAFVLNVAITGQEDQGGDTGGIQDLGRLDLPGQVMKDRTYSIKPGDSLRFTSPLNQIFGVAGLEVTPAGGLDVQRDIVKDSSGALGDVNLWATQLTVPEGATPGTTFDVQTQAPYQSRNDPNFTFSFRVKVANP